MDPFQRRKLGRSEIMLPIFGLGGAPLGDLYTKVSDADAEATIAAAWDEGVRYYDTAPWYGRGQSEHRMGRFLRRQPRSEVLISTKVGRVLSAPINLATFNRGMWTGGLDFEIRFDYSYDGIMRSYEDSLQRLGMNRIDILVIHDLDFWHHRTEPYVAALLAQLTTSGYRALRELKEAGLIGAIGAGINELGMIPRFYDFFDLDFFLVALRYTLGEQETLDRELPLCVEKGASIIVGGVFSSGIYATGPVPGAKYNYADASPAEMERGAEDRSGVQAPRRAAGGRRAAIPTASSGDRLGHSGRLPARPGERQPRLDAPRDPGSAMGRAEGRTPDPRRRADAIGPP